MNLAAVEPIRLALAAGMLVLGSYWDLRTREVDDRLWLGASIAGVALLVTELLLGLDLRQLSLYGMSIGVAGAMAFLFYRFGLFGGADAKALVTLGVVMPLFAGARVLHPLVPLAALTNSVFLTLALPVYYGVRNGVRLLRKEPIFQGFEREPRWKKALVCLLGYRLRGKGRFLFSLEKTEGGARRFEISLLRGDVDFVEAGDVWVTPGLPMLVFMTAGFLVLLLYGDLLAAILRGPL